MEVLILHPDAPDKSSLARLRQWIDVKNQATHLAQKLAPHILNLVVLAVEAIRVQEDHLQETARDKFRGEKAGKFAQNLLLHSRLMLQRLKVHALRQLGPAQEVLVAVRYRPQLLIRAQILDVRFHQR